jgi:signal transduction histidine kinase
MPGQSTMIAFIIVSLMLLLLSAFIISLLFKVQTIQIFNATNTQKLILSHQQNKIQTHLESYEEAMRVMSKEIHDHISLTMALCKLNLHSIDFNNPPEMVSKVNKSLELMTKTMSSLNHISKSFDPDYISMIGLCEAIKHEANELELCGKYTVNLLIKGRENRLKPVEELMVFRIIQEAINNIIKHANASIIDIEIEYTIANISYKIKDNGCGYDVVAKKTSATCGLKNMKNRASLIGAHLEITSTISTGTIINILLPTSKPQIEYGTENSDDPNRTC